jgi:hypothetical protein
MRLRTNSCRIPAYRARLDGDFAAGVVRCVHATPNLRRLIQNPDMEARLGTDRKQFNMRSATS